MTKPNQHNKPDPDKPGYAANPTKAPEDEMLKRPNQDVTSVRAKNSGHGKKTADKWNQ
jgi:hypothetical protein